MEDNDQMQREIAAMADLGKKRLQAKTIIFAISAVIIMVLLIASGIGFLIAFFVSAPLAALLAVALAKGLNDKFITETAAKHSIPREALAADKYLID